MRRSRIIYCAAIFVCAAFSVIYKSRISAVLLFSVLGYIPLALIAAAVSLFFVKIRFADSRCVSPKNAVFDIKIIISNGCIFPCAPIELMCYISDKETGIFSDKKVYASLSPFGKCRIAISCRHKYRGSYTAQIYRIAVFDPLRIIRLSRRVDEKMTQIFLPRKIILGNISAENSGESSAAQSKLLSGEKSEFSHVRDYHSGDLIQLVHWKLTAKTNEVMIKQFDELNDKRTIILCDYSSHQGDSDELLRADYLVETVIAIALSCAQEGVDASVDFGANDKNFICEITKGVGFNRFYELMSVLPSKLDTCCATSLLEEYADANASLVFLVTSKLTRELIATADSYAESFKGTLILVLVDVYNSPLVYEAENSHFLFLNIQGDPELGFDKAIADLDERLSNN